MPKNYYVVCRISRVAETVNNFTVDLRWHDDQYGAMPVFTNKKAAEKCAGNEAQIFTMKKL